jgi:hypothetical protein
MPAGEERIELCGSGSQPPLLPMTLLGGKSRGVASVDWASSLFVDWASSLFVDWASFLSVDWASFLYSQMESFLPALEA